MLKRQNLFWPTMEKDCLVFAMGCEKCKKHANIHHVPTEELHSIIKSWPFLGWALDLIGRINPASSKGHQYILVVVDYFLKIISFACLESRPNRYYQLHRR